MQRIGFPFNIIESVDSTNRLAMERGAEGNGVSGEVFFALEQTAGKGQRGRKWTAQAGQNITMSILLDPLDFGISGMFRLSCAAALAATDLLGRYAGEETSLKWPNDIYWRDRKAGGILIENMMRGQQWRWAVIGFGININQTSFDPDLPNPVSLKQITGRNFDPVQMAKELCADLQHRINTLFQVGFEPLLQDYQQRLFGRGRLFRFQHNNDIFNAIIQGVDADGQLITEDGQIRKYRFGEISWLGPA